MKIVRIEGVAAPLAVPFPGNVGRASVLSPSTRPRLRGHATNVPTPPHPTLTQILLRRFATAAASSMNSIAGMQTTWRTITPGTSGAKTVTKGATVASRVAQGGATGLIVLVVGRPLAPVALLLPLLPSPPRRPPCHRCALSRCCLPRMSIVPRPGPPRTLAPARLQTVHATGVVKETGKTFWSTKDAGQSPFTYQAGVGGVIPGWDQGCLGMALGEARELVIPAAEGYGAGGFPAWGIPPGATLNFTLECLKIA